MKEKAGVLFLILLLILSFSFAVASDTITTTIVSPTSPINEGLKSNFSCSNNASQVASLYINGIDKSSERGLLINRTAGTYNVSCIFTGNNDYSASSSEKTYVINKLASSSSATTSAVVSQQNKSKIEKGYSCLESKVTGKCSSLTIPEIAFTILSSPSSDVSTECESALNEKKSLDNCWPDGNCNVKDTALAILALNNLGEKTTDAENWLLSQNKTAKDLIWYLQQDSNEASACTISYDSGTYPINVGTNKKIDSSAGSCLSLTSSSFWLQVSPNCFNKEFLISCDKNFISTLLYQHQNSNIVYVLSDTQSAAAFGTVNLNINAQCLSTSSNCNYEENVWAVLALQKTGHNVKEFMPYVIALSDSNKQYLPDAFSYMITNNDDYGKKLLQEQKVGNYWQADSTQYNKFYDTAIALISLRQSSSDQAVKARDWLLFSQGSEGCWQDSIRDTSIVLWALSGKSSRSGKTSVTYCDEANFFCIAKSSCPESDKLTNYFCSGLSTICCKNENLKSCSDLSGKICSSGQTCSAQTKKASDTASCCVGSCNEAKIASECEKQGFICKTSCSDTQEKASYTCDSGICCKTKAAPTSSSTWIWILVIGIIIILAVILFLLRDRLRLWLFKAGKGSKQPAPQSSGGPGFPPRPGFPPIRRQQPPMPIRRMMPQPARFGGDRIMDDTFKKLKDMTK